jgi:hypothetical protein
MLLLGAVSAMLVALGLLGAMGAFASGGAPGVETERAEQVERTAAVVTATVEPNGAETHCEFEYGTSEGSLNKTAPCAFAPGERPIKVREYAQLGSLTQTTTYYFRIKAENINGPKTGKIHEFDTLPNKPLANTEEAIEVKHTSATLTGYVTPKESEVTGCYFSWGTSPGSETNTATCEPSTIAAGGEPSIAKYVTAKIPSGLAEKTTYYFRLHATNEFGEDKGGNNNFTTQPSAPNPGQLLTSKVERTTATLHGIVIPDGAKVETCTFEYGPPEEPETPLEKSIPCESLPKGEGEAKEPVSVNLTGLNEATTYGYRLVAKNSLGTGRSGNANTFTTRPTAPSVLMHHARNVTNESAELAASVNPEGGEVTQCFFEYGTTRALGKVAPCAALPGSGEKYVKVDAKISGLMKETEYLVRIVAVNAGGTGRGGEGEKHNFTTSNGEMGPVVEKIKPKKGNAKGGANVTISGEHFEHVIAVFFGDAEVKPSKEETKKLEVIAPPGVGKVEVRVLTKAGISEPSAGAEFTYGKPELTSISPNEGPVAGGNDVTVKGFGFEPGEHGTVFEFKNNASSGVDCTSTTECTVLVPAGKKPKSINVQAGVAGQKSNKLAYKYN